MVCTENHIISNRKYYYSHRDRILEKQRLFRLANKREVPLENTGRFKPQLVLALQLPDSIREWVTGFTEGDGSVGIYNGKKCHHPFPVVYYGQKVREPLDYISSFYGGVVNKTDKSPIYTLTYGANKVYPFISDFRDKIVSKHFLERLNVVLQFLNMKQAKLTKPTIDWFVGFWDAEGSSNNKPELAIEQKESFVLEQIAKEFGGYVIELHNHRPLVMYRWCMGGKNQIHDLVYEIINRSRYPQKAERLRNNYEGQSYYHLHPEVNRKSVIKYRLKNKDKINESHRLHYQENIEDRREYFRDYHSLHRDKLNTRRMQRYYSLKSANS